MKRVHIMKAISLSLLFSSSLFADIHDRIEYKLNRILRDIEIINDGNTGNCSPINQVLINQGGGTYTITHSGPYCLEQDVVGSIVVASNNVTLDLNSFQVNGNGNSSAISATGQNNVTIQNGAITNAGSICISAVNSIGVNIDNIQAYNTESAVQLSGCSNSSINNLRVYECLSTFAALLFIDSSDSVEVTDSIIQGNTKNATGTTNEFTPGTAFVCVNNSTNVNFTRVFANTNIFNNTTPIANQNSHWRTASAIAFLQSQNCTLTDCSTNNNTDVAGNLATPDTEDYLVLFRGCSNCTITRLQSNANACNEPILYFSLFSSFDSSNIIIQESSVTENTIVSLDILPFASFAPLIFISPYFEDHEVNDTLIRNCQISQNVIVDGGSGRTTSEGDLICIYVFGLSGTPGFENRTIIENCQVTDNMMTSTQPVQLVEAILVEQAADVSIINCKCDGNSGGDLLLSIVLEGGVGNSCRNAIISNTTANNNSNENLAFGITLYGDLNTTTSLRGACENCTIINCQANGNNGTQNGSGIAIAGTTGCSIINCQTDANSRSGIYSGFVHRTQPLNQDNSILNCSAKNNVLDGFELSSTGTNNNFLLKDNVALDNGNIGFFDENPLLTSRYLGNYAKDNSINYTINGGAIQLFSLDAAGIYTNVTGDATHFSALVNVEGV